MKAVQINHRDGVCDMTGTFILRATIEKVG